MTKSNPKTKPIAKPARDKTIWQVWVKNPLPVYAPPRVGARFYNHFWGCGVASPSCGDHIQPQAEYVQLFRSGCDPEFGGNFFGDPLIRWGESLQAFADLHSVDVVIYSAAVSRLDQTDYDRRVVYVLIPACRAPLGHSAAVVSRSVEAL